MAPTPATAAITRWTDALPIPPRATPIANPLYPGADYYEIAMTQGSWRFHSQLNPAATWGYWAGTTGMGYLGPTIEARTGRPVVAKFINNLPTTHLFQQSIDRTLWDGSTNDPAGGRGGPYPDVRSVVHLHGGFTPPQFDGHPEAWYTPDGLSHGMHYATLDLNTAPNSAVYWYSNQQPATALWYHDHAMSITRLNVYAGLASVYFVRDSVEDGLNIPKGNYEIPLILQDKTFNPDGSLFYPTVGVSAVHPIWMPEFFGDTPVVNGKAYPFLNVEPRRYRFRVLNACNARFLNVWLEDANNKQYPFYVIGTDGGFLPAPVRFDGAKSKLLAAPAERFDVIVDFSGLAGKTLTLMNNAKAPYPGGQGGQINQIMQFRVGTTVSSADTTTPASQLALPAITRLNPATANKRDLVLIETADPATGEPMHALFNERFFMEAAEENPRVGSTEVWEIANATGDAHPVHLHLVEFQVIERQAFNAAGYSTAYLAWVAAGRPAGGKPVLANYLSGKPTPAAPEEMGPNDTVKSYPGTVTRVIAKFEIPPMTTLPAHYVYHCHILEHEDNEMMRPMHVVP